MRFLSNGWWTGPNTMVPGVWHQGRKGTGWCPIWGACLPLLRSLCPSWVSVLGCRSKVPPTWWPGQQTFILSLCGGWESMVKVSAGQAPSQAVGRTFPGLSPGLWGRPSQACPLVCGGPVPGLSQAFTGCQRSLLSLVCRSITWLPASIVTWRCACLHVCLRMSPFNKGTVILDEGPPWGPQF